MADADGGRRGKAPDDSRRSCMPCASGKRACDGTRPCGRCFKLGRTDKCVDAPFGYKRMFRKGGQEGGLAGPSVELEGEEDGVADQSIEEGQGMSVGGGDGLHGARAFGPGPSAESVPGPVSAPARARKRQRVVEGSNGEGEGRPTLSRRKSLSAGPRGRQTEVGKHELALHDADEHHAPLYSQPVLPTPSSKGKGRTHVSLGASRKGRGMLGRGTGRRDGGGGRKRRKDAGEERDEDEDVAGHQDGDESAGDSVGRKYAMPRAGVTSMLSQGGMRGGTADVPWSTSAGQAGGYDHGMGPLTVPTPLHLDPSLRAAAPVDRGNTSASGRGIGTSSSSLSSGTLGANWAASGFESFLRASDPGVVGGLGVSNLPLSGVTGPRTWNASVSPKPSPLCMPLSIGGGKAVDNGGLGAGGGGATQGHQHADTDKDRAGAGGANGLARVNGFAPGQGQGQGRSAHPTHQGTSTGDGGAPYVDFKGFSPPFGPDPDLGMGFSPALGGTGMSSYGGAVPSGGGGAGLGASFTPDFTTNMRIKVPPMPMPMADPVKESGANAKVHTGVSPKWVTMGPYAHAAAMVVRGDLVRRDVESGTWAAPIAPAKFTPYLDEDAALSLPLMKLVYSTGALTSNPGLGQGGPGQGQGGKAEEPLILRPAGLAEVLRIAASVSVHMGGMVVPLCMRPGDTVPVRPVAGVKPDMEALGGLQLDLDREEEEEEEKGKAAGEEGSSSVHGRECYALDEEPLDRLGLRFPVAASDVGFRTAEDYVRTLAIPWPSGGHTHVPDDVLDELTLGALLPFPVPTVRLLFSADVAQAFGGPDGMPRIRSLFSNRHATALFIPPRDTLSRVLNRSHAVPWLAREPLWQDRRRFLFANAHANRHKHFAFRGRCIARTGEALTTCLSAALGCTEAVAAARIAAAVPAHGLGAYLLTYPPGQEVQAQASATASDAPCVFIDSTELGCLDYDATGCLRSLTCYYTRLRLCEGTEPPVAQDLPGLSTGAGAGAGLGEAGRPARNGLEGIGVEGGPGAVVQDSDVPCPLPLSPAQWDVLRERRAQAQVRSDARARVDRGGGEGKGPLAATPVPAPTGRGNGQAGGRAQSADEHAALASLMGM